MTIKTLWLAAENVLTDFINDYIRLFLGLALGVSLTSLYYGKDILADDLFYAIFSIALLLAWIFSTVRAVGEFILPHFKTSMPTKMPVSTP